MAIQTLYACDIPLDASGVCLGNSTQFEIDTDLVTALNTHSVALDDMRLAMDDFFTLSTEDVGLVSATMLIAFIIGNSTGRVVGLLRKM